MVVWHKDDNRTKIFAASSRPGSDVASLLKGVGSACWVAADEIIFTPALPPEGARKPEALPKVLSLSSQDPRVRACSEWLVDAEAPEARVLSLSFDHRRRQGLMLLQSQEDLSLYSRIFRPLSPEGILRKVLSLQRFSTAHRVCDEYGLNADVVRQVEWRAFIGWYVRWPEEDLNTLVSRFSGVEGKCSSDVEESVRMVLERLLRPQRDRNWVVREVWQLSWTLWALVLGNPELLSETGNHRQAVLLELATNFVLEELESKEEHDGDTTPKEKDFSMRLRFLQTYRKVLAAHIRSGSESHPFSDPVCWEVIPSLAQFLSEIPTEERRVPILVELGCSLASQGSVEAVQVLLDEYPELQHAVVDVPDRRFALVRGLFGDSSLKSVPLGLDSTTAALTIISALPAVVDPDHYWRLVSPSKAASPDTSAMCVVWVIHRAILVDEDAGRIRFSIHLLDSLLSVRNAWESVSHAEWLWDAVEWMRDSAVQLSQLIRLHCLQALDSLPEEDRGVSVTFLEWLTLGRSDRGEQRPGRLWNLSRLCQGLEPFIHSPSTIVRRFSEVSQILISQDLSRGSSSDPSRTVELSAAERKLREELCTQLILHWTSLHSDDQRRRQEGGRRSEEIPKDAEDRFECVVALFRACRPTVPAALRLIGSGLEDVDKLETNRLLLRLGLSAAYFCPWTGFRSWERLSRIFECLPVPTPEDDPVSSFSCARDSINFALTQNGWGCRFVSGCAIGDPGTAGSCESNG